MYFGMYVGFCRSSPCHALPIHQRWNREVKHMQHKEGGPVSVKREHCLVLKFIHFGNAFSQHVHTLCFLWREHWLIITSLYVVSHISNFKTLQCFFSLYVQAPFCGMSTLCLTFSGNINELCYLSSNSQHDLWLQHLTRTIALTSALKLPVCQASLIPCEIIIKLQLWDDKSSHCLTLWTVLGHVPLSHEHWVSHFLGLGLYPFRQRLLDLTKFKD